MELSLDVILYKALTFIGGMLLYLLSTDKKASGIREHTNTQLNRGTIWVPHNTSGSRPCPCSDLAFCDRIKEVRDKEILIFSLNKDNWRKYDWTKVTTIVEVGYHDDELVCFAHSKGSRVVSIANIDVDKLTNISARSEWISQQVSHVQSNFLDGVNVDFESQIPKQQADVRKGLTDLMEGLKNELKARFSSSQVTIDFAWSPDCIDQRCYDYKRLSDIVDYAFVMAYDERSQIPGDCIAGANSNYTTTLKGLKEFLNIGVVPRKLILGVPWYGYVYPCISYRAGICQITHVPFRGVNCSDAAGKQYGYSTVISKFLPISFTGRQWDGGSKSPYFAFKNSTGTVYQVWFDDPESLNIKYQMAVDLDLGGLGMWEADDIDYSNGTQISEMWGAFPY